MPEQSAFQAATRKWRVHYSLRGETRTAHVGKTTAAIPATHLDLKAMKSNMSSMSTVDAKLVDKWCKRLGCITDGAAGTRGTSHLIFVHIYTISLQPSQNSKQLLLTLRRTAVPSYFGHLVSYLESTFPSILCCRWNATKICIGVHVLASSKTTWAYMAH